MFKLWTAKESDYFYVDMWKRESVDGKGPKPVKDAITLLAHRTRPLSEAYFLEWFKCK